jgi:hypothetical protein
MEKVPETEWERFWASTHFYSLFMLIGTNFDYKKLKAIQMYVNRVKIKQL